MTVTESLSQETVTHGHPTYAQEQKNLATEQKSKGNNARIDAS